MKNKPLQNKAKELPLLLPEIKKNAGWKPYLVLTIFAFVLYSNTLNHFYALDDGIVLMENNFTQKGIGGIAEIFKYDTFVGNIVQLSGGTKTAEQVQEEMKYLAGGRYRPLSLATFALEIELFGKKQTYPNSTLEFIGNPFVSHLNNILLYLLTTCLLFLILFRIFPQKEDEKWYLSLPFIITLLFLAHPIHTEVVANIKGRDEIMTLLGSLAALWFSIKYFDTNKIYYLVLSGLCLFLGLLSKENAITFLAVIPLTLYYFLASPKISHRSSKSNYKETRKIIMTMIPLIVASAIFLLMRASVIAKTVSSVSPELMNNPFLNASESESMATIFFTLIFYVKLLFIPHPLTWDYYPHHIEIVNWMNPVAFFSLLFYVGIGIYAVYGLFKKRDIISYSIWFYLLPLSVVSNIFFPIGAFMGERFIYISSIGFCILLGWLIYKYVPKINNNIYLVGFVLLIILGLYSGKTIWRNLAWKDSFILLTTDVHTSNNSAKGNYVVGFEMLKRVAFAESEEDFQRREEFCKKGRAHLKRAIELHPTYTDAIESLGNLCFDCYLEPAKSLHYYARALSRNTTRDNEIYEQARKVLNIIRKLLADNNSNSTPEEIIQSCEELIKVKPEFGEAYFILGLIYGKYLNNHELSLINFEKANSLNFPKSVNFYEDLGTVYGIAANYEKSRQYFLKAIEMGSNDYIIYNNLGITCQFLGDMKSANYYISKSNEIKAEIEKFNNNNE